MITSPAAALARWVPRPTPALPPRWRLFCFPYAGSGLAVYWQWRRQLPADVDLCPVQLPGRDGRIAEPAYRRLEPMVAALVEALGPLLDRPYALFGHSMGALIAFELAQAIRRHALPGPSRLFVSGRRAPQVPDRRPPLHNLAEEEFLAGLQQRYGQLPEVLLRDAEMRQLFLPMMRADLAVVESYSYQPTPPLACPISVLSGSHDPAVTHSDLDAWRHQTAAECSLTVLDGDHFYLKSQAAPLVAHISAGMIRSSS